MAEELETEEGEKTEHGSQTNWTLFLENNRFYRNQNKSKGEAKTRGGAQLVKRRQMHAKGSYDPPVTCHCMMSLVKADDGDW